MTEAERQALIEDITNAVMTKLNENSVDWSSHTITFGDRYDIQVNERQNIKVPAIDKRNGITYGNLDLNTLLTAFGLTQAMKSASDAEKAGNDAVTNIENAKDTAMSAIVSKTESEKADISTHANAERGTISTVASNSIIDVEQSRDTAKTAISSLASSEKAEISTLSATKKSELDAIVATGISNIQQTVTSTEDDGNNEITITMNNETTKKFTVQNGSKGSTGETGNGIKSITVAESSADNGNNVITITMTDGTFKTFNVKNGSKGSVENIASYLADYLPLSGGTMTGSVTLEGATLKKPLIVSGGDSATAGKIIFGENGQITNEATATLVGIIGASFYLGHSTYPIYLRGKNIRPYYNTANNTLALSSDIPTSLPASDVYAWAKASTKPTYTASEVGASASGHSHSEYKVVTNYAHGTTGTKTLSAIAVNQMGFFSYRFDGSGGSVKLPSGGTYLAMTFYNQGDESNHVTFSKSSYVSLSGGAIIASINPDNDLNSSYAYCYGIYIRKS